MTNPQDATTIRIGHGFDVHRFSDDPTRMLVLGGVNINGGRGLHGHSDADVVLHAIVDAVLGASGRGDIGQHFPDTDPKWSGVASSVIATQVRELLATNFWRVGNVDCTVVCEEPKISPFRDAMQNRCTELFGAPVTIKGKRAEGLGAIGRAEGIACWANALVFRT